MSPQNINNINNILCPRSPINSSVVDMANQSPLSTSSITRRLSSTLTANSRKLPLTSLFKRRPVRRALVELGKNDRQTNEKLAQKLLTISAEEFKTKWDFDPIKMKPITSKSSNRSGEAETVKYEWKLINSNNKSEHRDNISTLCSLVPGSRSQLYLATLPRQRSSRTNITEVISADIDAKIREVDTPETKEDSSIKMNSNTVLSTVNSVGSTDSSAREVEQSKNSSVSNSIQGLLTDTSVTGRITGSVNSDHVTNIPVVSVVPTCTANDSNYRQTKITDFTTHRKRVHDSKQQPTGADMSPTNAKRLKTA